MRRSRVESHDFNEWRQAFRQFFGEAELHPRDGTHFTGLIESFTVGRVEILSVRASLKEARLPAAVHDVMHDRALSVLANLSREPVDILQLGRVASLAEGEAAVFAEAEEVLIKTTGQMNWLILRVCRSHVTGQRDGIIARKAASNNEALRLLLAQVNWMKSLQDLGDPVVLHELGRHLASLLRLSITRTTELPEEREKRRRISLEEILHRLDQRYMEPTFSVSDVAAEHQVSTRYVQTVLHDNGFTFSERLLELRLERAFTLLLDARNSGRKIVDIAFECGFADVSYFHRRFRDRFGISAGKARPTG